MNCRENCFILNPNPPPTREGSFMGNRKGGREGGRRNVGVRELEGGKWDERGRKERGRREGGGRHEGGLR